MDAKETIEETLKCIERHLLEAAMLLNALEQRTKAMEVFHVLDKVGMIGKS